MKLLTTFLALIFAVYGSTDTNEISQAGQQALQAIHWNWQKLVSRLVIRFEPAHPKLLAKSNLTDSIDVYVQDPKNLKQIQKALVHEFGHMFEYFYLNDEQRKLWRKVRNIPPGTPWRVKAHQTDYKFGVGDFVECFSTVILGPNIEFYSKLGPPPNAKQQNLIRRWLREQGFPARE